MKKCSGCHKEIDKYAIACQYCGKLNEEKGKNKTSPEEHSEEESKREKE